MDRSFRKMTSSLVSLVVLPVVVTAMLLTSLPAFAGQQFPTSPDPEMTPGSLCTQSSAVRYPERIRYCSRNVDPKLKNQIIREYDQELGFNVRQMARRNFKIDHFIPLCAGGSNNKDNLWPQHESVYEITDPLEPAVCEKMASGRLAQAEAIRLIRAAKTDLSKAEEIFHYIESL